MTTHLLYKVSFYLQMSKWNGRIRETNRQTDRQTDRKTERVGQERLGFTLRGDRYIQSFTACFFHRKLIQDRLLNLGTTFSSSDLTPKRHDFSTLLTILPDWLLGLKSSVISYFSDALTFLLTQFMWYFCCLLCTLKHSCTSCFWNP